ncbi:YggT family protein [Candidatus Roizmanbacteria bacterium]|nr:YggT family protein [Candidatus Roizmanbacteria bacterium]
MSPQDVQTQEEIITSVPTSQQVVKKITRQVEAQVKGEAPQKVYDKKKTIFRSTQIIWYILGFIEVLLAFRILLKMLGANSSVGFTSLIYSLTAPLALPFSGILGVSIEGTSLIEWSTIIAAIVYLCIAWGLVYLLDIIYPITPKDMEIE